MNELTDEQVRCIRQRRAFDAVTLRDLAREFNRSRSYIGDLCVGRCRVDAGGPIVGPYVVANNHLKYANHRDPEPDLMFEAAVLGLTWEQALERLVS